MFFRREAVSFVQMFRTALETVSAKTVPKRSNIRVAKMLDYRAGPVTDDGRAALTTGTPPGYNGPMIAAEPPMMETERGEKVLRVAIDGPAGAGKSTVARQVAARLGLTYVDTGAMYRALAWAVVEARIAPDDAAAVCALAARLDVRLEPGGGVLVDGQDAAGEIRTPEISNLTSPLSALPCVRTRMVALQQAMARRGGVVMEGRDIGTVVLPDAEVKVFLIASLAERVRRRGEELAQGGVVLPPEELARDIAARDARDAERDVAPMVPAHDAVTLDSDGLNIEAVVGQILVLCAKARASDGR